VADGRSFVAPERGEHVRNFGDIETALGEMRTAFRSTVTPVRQILDDCYALYFDFMALAQTWVRPQDDERYALEALGVMVRRVTASVVLLESGLPQEAHMILRHALELMLIAIDILYNPDSLREWKATQHDDLLHSVPKNWYFKMERVCKRLENNQNGVYPELERHLAANIKEEVNRISNISLHAHSYAQLVPLLDGSGGMQLLGRKTSEDYAKDFHSYGVFLLNTVTILLGTPKMRGFFAESLRYSAQARQIADMYSKAYERYCESERVRVPITSKQQLVAMLRDVAYPFDISSIPDKAAIRDVSIDLTDPQKPRLKVLYDE
jgi:hypothetical protein